MMRIRMSQRLIGASDWLYRLLLHAYPRDFRREYGSQMAQVFHDCCREAQHRSGVPGVIALWIATFIDLITTALTERISERRRLAMSSKHLIRWSGLASMIGGVLWLVLSTGLAIRWPMREYIGPLLAAVGCAFLAGLLGLYAGYSARVGYTGKLGLVMAAIGVIPVVI